jgi:sigma-B regulation protein RsbQ
MGNNILLRNNVKIFGDGAQSMVFAHGYGCDQHMWRFITPAFEKDYRVILFDHVGSGKSDQCAYDFKKYSSLKGYAKDFIEICDDLGLQGIIFVGHSVTVNFSLMPYPLRLFEDRRR